MNEAASRRHEYLADRRGKLLTTAAELREWLMVEGFRARRASRAELASVRELRACLHVLVVANAHRSTDDGALRSLTLLAEERPVRFTFASSAISSATSSATPSVMSRSSANLAPSCRGVDAVIATILSIVASAMAEATWPRLKACGHCGWVVYDRTKNQSVSWCAEEACGSRSRARSYRARHRSE